MTGDRLGMIMLLCDAQSAGRTVRAASTGDSLTPFAITHSPPWTGLPGVVFEGLQPQVVAPASAMLPSNWLLWW